jgi:phosphatidylglycerophosphate synthase
MHPQRPHILAKFRQYTDYWPSKLPLPKVDPNFISFLSCIFSLFFLIIWQTDFPQKIPISFTCLIFSLMLDWLDGLIARKHKIASEKGWLMDTASDRLSEIFILLSFPFFPWLYLVFWNILLSFISYLTKKQFTMHLRLFFLIYFVFEFLL